VINGHPQSWDECFEAHRVHLVTVDERLQAVQADRDVLAATLREVLGELDEACWISAERKARWRATLDEHGGAKLPDVADHADRIGQAIRAVRGE
jgi:hypothetical protein